MRREKNTVSDNAIRMDAPIEQLLLKHRKELAERDHAANKGTYGRLTLAAGSNGMAGAAFLSGLAAFRCGIGMVKYLGHECNRVILQSLLPEAMYENLPELLPLSDAAAILAEKLSWGDYLVVGPGLSRSDEAKELIRTLFQPEVIESLQKKKLLVLDADALNIMAEEGLDPRALRNEKQPVETLPIVITPHIMEMSRLTGLSIPEIKADPQKTADEYAKTHGIYVVLKDDRTVVASPDPAFKPLLLDSGCGAMAKAGSGDVLCGFITGVTAMLFGNVSDALPLAVFLHGAAGCVASERTGCHSLLARDIAESAGEALMRSLGLIRPVHLHDLS